MCPQAETELDTLQAAAAAFVFVLRYSEEVEEV